MPHTFVQHTFMIYTYVYRYQYLDATHIYDTAIPHNCNIHLWYIHIRIHISCILEIYSTETCCFGPVERPTPHHCNWCCSEFIHHEAGGSRWPAIAISKKDYVYANVECVCIQQPYCSEFVHHEAGGPGWPAIRMMYYVYVSQCGMCVYLSTLLQPHHGNCVAEAGGPGEPAIAISDMYYLLCICQCGVQYYVYVNT